jgi:hypothetical protein
MLKMFKVLTNIYTVFFVQANLEIKYFSALIPAETRKMFSKISSCQLELFLFNFSQLSRKFLVFLASFVLEQYV